MRIWIVAVGILTAVLLRACATTSKQPPSDTATDTPAEVNTQLGIAYMRKGMYEASLEKFKRPWRRTRGFPSHMRR